MSSKKTKSAVNPEPCRRVRYHLRATLAPEHFSAEEKALWKVINEGRIDDVMFFVPHAEERSQGLGTPEENRQMAALLKPLFSRLRKRGITPSINIWWTVAFSDFPNESRDQRRRASFRWAVNLQGESSHAAACPLDEAWRAHVSEMYRTYAALKPERIWIDDDMRMTLRADMQCPCVCDECLGELSRRVGRKIARKDFLREVLSDPPNPVRDAWLEYQNSLAVDICGRLAREVHSVSTGTRVCLMHSGMEAHAAEGRKWSELIESLGSPRPMLRPGIGPYNETAASGIASALNGFRHTLAALPLDMIDIAPEIENYPGSRFVKSMKLVELDLTMAQIFGVPEATLSIFRFGGGLDRELARDMTWVEGLARIKPRLQSIADLDIRPDQARGAGLFFHEETCRHTRNVQDQPKPIFVYRERPWDNCLPLFGIATQYGVGTMTAFSGEQIDCLTDSELDKVFARGVLLDARAAESLLLRGKGTLAGIKCRKADAAGIQEMISDKAFGGIAGDVMNLRWDGPSFQFDLMPGARSVSRLIGYDGKDHGHGVTIFENRLGGRVAVFPYDGQFRGAFNLGSQVTPLISPSFLSWTRQAQMRDVLEWLGREPLPLFVQGAPSVYPLLIEQSDRLIIGVANLLPDPVQNLTLRLGCKRLPFKRLRILHEDGKWSPLRAEVKPGKHGIQTITTEVCLGYFDVAVITLE